MRSTADLMRAHRPESVVHLAFILDPLRSGVVDKKRMWQVNVAGTSRVTEAIAEHNRMLGVIDKFIFPAARWSMARTFPSRFLKTRR